MSDEAVGRKRVIYLARHGETEWNRLGRWQGHTDIPLTELGRSQARALAERLRGEPVRHIVASDLSRARETALIVAEALGGLPVLEDADLRERMFGAFEGLTRTQCETERGEDWARYLEDPSVGPPGAESHAAIVARTRRALMRAAALPGAEGILLVTHGGVMRVLGNAIGNVGTEPIRNGEVFRIDVFAAGALGVARWFKADGER
jgi:broad specificity phosphatase PhoE